MTSLPRIAGTVRHQAHADEHRLRDGAGGDMDITTSRFGALQVLPSDILVFEQD